MNLINGFIFTVGLLLAIGSSDADLQKSHLKIKSERIGSDFNLSCFAEDQEDSTLLSLEWVGPSGVNVGKGAHLNLKNVQPEEIGKYTCRSYIIKDSKLVKSEIQSLIATKSSNHVEILNEFQDEKSLHLDETHSLDIFCETSDSSNTEEQSHWIKPDGSRVSDNGRLLIESLQQKRDQGKYICLTQKSDGSGTVVSMILDLHIKASHITIKTLPSESIQLHGMIHRQCAGSEPSSDTESFDYKWIDSKNVIVSDSDILQIPINDLSVLGEYRCICKSKVSYMTYETSTTIYNNQIQKIKTDEYKIHIVSSPSQFRFGERFSLTCETSPNIENLSYQWSKDNVFLSSNKVLTLESFGKTDTGVYTCKASGNDKDVTVNIEANSSQFICNFQHRNIELATGAGPQILLKIKQSKELHCEIETFNDNHRGKDVQWTFKNKKLDEPSLEQNGLSRFDTKWTSILVIEEATLNNEGKYTCIVDNKEKSIDVVIVSEPGFVYVHPQEVEVPKGADVEFHCRIDGVKDITNKNLKWTFVADNGTTVALPNAKWKVSNPCPVSHSTFVSSNNTKIEDNGYLVCTTPDGKQSKGRLIVKEPETPNKVIATPPVLNVYKSQKFEFECFTTDTMGNSVAKKPEVRFPNGDDVKSDSRFVVSDIGPSRIKIEAPRGLDISEKELKVICEVNGSKAPISINLKIVCPPNQKSCKNGECVDSTNFCDGKKDCADGSDEDRELCYECDPVNKPCGAPSNSSVHSPEQFFSINWACDGEKDCKNGFDESNCPKSDDVCSTQYFTCNDDTRIPFGYVCDGRSDCDNNEDEIGCVKPQILRTSDNKIRATSGSTVTMICEAVGYPLPTIVWRYNWGCTRDTPRISVKEVSKNCKNVVSVLTINDFQTGDDAIYGCEAISGGSRVFGNDFFVTMN